MNFDFREAAKKNILIVAHRGVSAGNIPCNTVPAYETALKQGADVIEVDVSKSADGVLYIFHPGMEEDHFNLKDKNFKKMTFAEIKNEHYVNYDNSVTQFSVPTFDEILERFKGRCFINIDKFWDNPKEIYEAIKKHNMESQIVVKSGYDEEVVRVLEELAPTLQFLPIVKDKNDIHELLMTKNINYLGAEVLFTDENAEVASDLFIEKMHRDNKLVWVNSIIYDYKEQLSAGHSDDTALCDSEEKGWGWLADKGYDFIQTDWPMMLIKYLKDTNRYYR